MVDPLFDYQFRLILLGDSTVGKSSILKYFCEGRFSPQSDPTVGVDFYTRLVEVRPGIRVKLQLWDTAGQERFRSITRSYYRNSVGGLIVYDITNRASFLNVTDWLQEAKAYMQPRDPVFLLIGHKTDLATKREVSQDEGEKLSNFYDMHFLETSAKTGLCIEDVFRMLSIDIYERLMCGQMKLEDGWEGIKPGFSRPLRHSVHIPSGQAEDTGCC